MKQNKLKLDELKVQSFKTGAENLTGGGDSIIDKTTFQPTPGTWCYVCPVTEPDLPIE